MSSPPVVFVGGNKGGVGKSVTSMALLDYWLSQQPPKPVFLIEADASNPDVAKAYGKAVAHFPAPISERDHWIDIVDELAKKEHRHSTVLFNLPAKSNDDWANYGGILLEGLKVLKRPAICLWLINRQRDSLQMLNEYRAMAPGVKIHVVRNAYFGDQAKFTRYNTSDLRKEIEAAGGKSVMLPEVADRIIDLLQSERMTIAEAAGEATILGTRTEAIRWRAACGAMFVEMGL